MRTAGPAVGAGVRRKLAEGEGFEPPKGLRPGGFQDPPSVPANPSALKDNDVAGGSNSVGSNWAE
jgi:hypothetical protein